MSFVVMEKSMMESRRGNDLYQVFLFVSFACAKERTEEKHEKK